MKNKIKIITFVFIFSLFTVVTYAAPDISAYSAVVMELKSGRVLYEKNPNDRKYMASTTKIMTALIAIEKGDLNKKAKISPQSTRIEGSSIYLEPNEEILLKDLLYGLMLRSGNDSADAIARYIGGDKEKFIAMMNTRAKELGAKNTNFMNPHGLHDSNHYTTAYDLALIAREAMKNKTFKQIVGTKLWVAARGEGSYNYFYNKNKVLSQYKGGTGVKTGYTKIAGRCLVSASERNGMELICVVLDDPNWFNDSYSLMDDVYKEYILTKIVDKGTPLKTVSVTNGEKDHTNIIAKEDVVFPIKGSELNHFTLQYDLGKNIQAPISRETKVGTLKVYLNNQLVDTVDLVTREDIESKDHSIIKKIQAFFYN